MTQIKRYFLHRPDHLSGGVRPEWDGLNVATYSRFKYGCAKSRLFFAVSLTKLMAQILPKTEEFVIASSSYLHVPSAANQLVREISALNWSNYQFSFTKFTRHKVLSQDFSKLRYSERRREIDKLSFDFNSQHILNERVVVIDDAYVTGTHEQAIRNQLEGHVKELLFFYIVDLSVFADPSLEHSLNNASVRWITDMLSIRMETGFEYNNRFLKRLFISDPDDLDEFLIYTPFEEQRTILDMALREGYPALGQPYEENVFRLYQKLALKNGQFIQA